MRSLIFGATALALAKGGTLNLAFNDCGAAHGKATGLSPTSIETGSNMTLTVVGTADEDVSGGSFEIDVKVSTFSTTFTGDLCQPKTFDIPLGLGSFSWEGMKCPQAKGDMKVPVDLKLSRLLPHGLEDVHLTIKAKTTAGDDLICMQVDSSPAELTAAAPSQEMEKLFADFMKKYQRQYATEAERNKRFKIFSDNMQMINFANARNVSYKLGVTSHADQTSDEWRAQRLTGFKAQPILTPMTNAFAAPADFAPPPSVDWVAKGAVTPVKNQGDCGSCWTFSTVGALEGAMFVAGRPLVELSMQNFLACDDGSKGCNGGSMVQAFQWAQTHGIPALKTEPYLCVDREASQCANMTCPAAGIYASVLAPGMVTGVTPLENSVDALEAAVAQQPVSVAIEADQFVFQHYTGGVLTDDACGSNLDHGVLAVGYGVDNGQAYWKVKNSWGPDWGEQGYIRIEKGKQAHGGECGIRSMAAYPTVAKQQSDTVVV